MPRCPKCLRSFRVLEDEDDGQHGCPRCGYGDCEQDWPTTEQAEPSETYLQYRREAEHAKRRLGLTEPQPDLTRYMAMLFKALVKK
jgi:hypothetical protein